MGRKIEEIRNGRRGKECRKMKEGK
jgi:hypothetical protein